jgi:hypothetical protein
VYNDDSEAMSECQKQLLRKVTSAGDLINHLNSVLTQMMRCNPLSDIATECKTRLMDAEKDDTSQRKRNKRRKIGLGDDDHLDQDTKARVHAVVSQQLKQMLEEFRSNANSAGTGGVAKEASTSMKTLRAAIKDKFSVDGVQAQQLLLRMLKGTCASCNLPRAQCATPGPCRSAGAHKRFVDKIGLATETGDL